MRLKLGLERGCLAVVRGVRRFDRYLFGRESVLQADHWALKYLGAAKYENNRVMRWAFEIANVSIPYPGHTWKGKCRRRFLEHIMTHVWEGGVLDRVCVLRSLLQERPSASLPSRSTCMYVCIHLYV